jgi:cyclophilin family peptidyl-prolyl cis-trans isomerase
LVQLLAACAAPEGGGEAEGAAARDSHTAPPTVVLETSRGRIVIQLDPERAPESVANFLLHVRSGFYDGLVFHRVIPDFVIQAGVLTADGQRRQSSAVGILNEADNGLRNLRGTVGMARTGDPHSATSEFYVNVKDNPRLDFREKTYEGWGYAVFGRVTEGMDVVDAIAAGPTAPRGRYPDLPTEPIVIRKASVRHEW